MLKLIYTAIAAVIISTPVSAADPLPHGLGHPKPGEKHFYSYQCCRMEDCEPVEPGAIMPKKDGYAVHYINYAGVEVRGFLKYGDPKIHLSQDNREHACSGAAAGTLYCIYVQLGM